jgi:hypothetical protein
MAEGLIVGVYVRACACACAQAYEERMLPVLKEDLPGLKLSQYKERIFEMWKKAPENPMNAARAAAGGGGAR